MKLRRLIRFASNLAIFSVVTTGLFFTSIKKDNQNISHTNNQTETTPTLSFGGEVALAGYGNWTYKVSSISNQDRLNFCRQTFRSRTITGAVGSGDSVICYFQGYPNAYYRNQGEICEFKHPGYGTWLGDGGASCYDSYWGWR
jgi:hypothetical protein